MVLLKDTLRNWKDGLISELSLAYIITYFWKLCFLRTPTIHRKLAKYFLGTDCGVVMEILFLQHDTYKLELEKYNLYTPILVWTGKHNHQVDTQDVFGIQKQLQIQR